MTLIDWRMRVSTSPKRALVCVAHWNLTVPDSEIGFAAAAKGRQHGAMALQRLMARQVGGKLKRDRMRVVASGPKPHKRRLTFRLVQEAKERPLAALQKPVIEGSER